MRMRLAEPQLMKLAGFTLTAKQILEDGRLHLIPISLSIIFQRRHPPSRFSAIDNYSVYDNALSVRYPLETEKFLKE